MFLILSRKLLVKSSSLASDYSEPEPWSDPELDTVSNTEFFSKDSSTVTSRDFWTVSSPKFNGVMYISSLYWDFLSCSCDSLIRPTRIFIDLKITIGNDRVAARRVKDSHIYHRLVPRLYLPEHFLV